MHQKGRTTALGKEKLFRYNNVQFCSSTYLMPGTMNVEHGLTQLWDLRRTLHLANHRSGIDMDIIIYLALFGCLKLNSF
jgi:hypothetical protein